MTTYVVRIDGLGERMRHAMRSVGLTAGEMALYLGVSRNAISEWLNGRAEPKLGMLRAWAQRTGVPVRWLAESGSVGLVQAYGAWLLAEQHPEHRVSDEDRLAYLQAHPDAAPAWEIAELEDRVRHQGLEPRTR